MKDLICIVCPRGCHLKVDEENDYKVTGNRCQRGVLYAYSELTNPTRVLTSTVVLHSGVGGGDGVGDVDARGFDGDAGRVGLDVSAGFNVSAGDRRVNDDFVHDSDRVKSLRTLHLTRLPVRTDKAIPKSKIPEAVAAIQSLVVHAPVRLGTVLLENVASTGANIIATRSILE